MPEFSETVVRINRVATVVKGGRRFSFSALVVVGNRRGRVGCGFGKANEVPDAVEKAVQDAHKHLVDVPVHDGTIPHLVWGEYGAAKVVLKPAPPGTGVIAGAAVRAVVVAAGVRNVFTKSIRSANPVNLVKAAMNGLTKLKTVEQVEKLRGVKLR
ncbi:MAG: 30S ribosomal protein S5 [Planctomycetota bacterium]